MGKNLLALQESSDYPCIFVQSGLSMKVCQHNGLSVVLLTGKQEHCPPHVHVKHEKWDATFKFSFLHDAVESWALDTKKVVPSKALLEAIRQTIEEPANVQACRKAWWDTHGARLKLCLTNRYWDPIKEDEVDGKNATQGMPQILSASYDPIKQVTKLTFGGGTTPVEIQL